MLFDLDGNQITGIPHKADYDRWIRGVTMDEQTAIIDAIHNKIADKVIFNASYLPGSDWTNTPFQPLYEACNRDETNAAYFYGMVIYS